MYRETNYGVRVKLKHVKNAPLNSKTFELIERKRKIIHSGIEERAIAQTTPFHDQIMDPILEERLRSRIRFR